MKSSLEFNLRRVVLLLLCALVIAGCATTPEGKPVTEPASSVEDEPSVTAPGEPGEAVPTEPEVAKEVLKRDVFIYRNDENLLHVYPGMKRKMVHKIMSGYRTNTWQNPCWTEKRIGQNGQIYEVEFYIVRKPTRTRPMGLRVMMPVIYDQADRVDTISRYRLKKLRVRTHLVTKNRSGCPIPVRHR